MNPENLLFSEDVDGIRLDVYYREDYRLVVTDTKSGKFLEETVKCNYTPLFGVDVADMADILQEAEKMAQRLESEEWKNG